MTVDCQCEVTNSAAAVAPLPVFNDFALESVDPGPLKCFCAPSHQILAKSAPPKARNRDKVEFATKVRTNINFCLTMNIKKAFNTSLFSLKL